MAIDVSQTFQDLMQALQQHAATNAAAMDGDGSQPRWFVPPNWTGNVFDIVGLREGFDRDIANKNYQDALSGSSIGPAMGAKTEIDYMAVHERAFRMRHMTPVRATAHAAGRLAGHGGQAGVHTGVVLQTVVSLYKSGKAQT